MVVCAGVEGAGKTYILKRLSCEEEVFDRRQLVHPTVGVSHYQVRLPVVGEKRADGKKKTRGELPTELVEVRELGGALAQNWPSYFRPEDRRLIFVVDANDASRLPEVAVHFVQCLETLAARAAGEDKASLLLLFSKTDLAGEERELLLKNEANVRQLLRLSDLTKWHEDNIEVEELSCSVWNEEGFPQIKDWILRKSLL